MRETQCSRCASFKSQLAQYNHVTRLLDDDGHPNAYGCTVFHRVNFGRQRKLAQYFSGDDEEFRFASAKIKFAEGSMNIDFWMVKRRFLTMEYRSPQNIYYPTSDYDFVEFDVYR
jgi:hypothetical protein